MRFRLVAVGKVREPHLRRAVDEYLERLRHYVPTEERELPDGKGLRAAIPAGWELVALEPNGRGLTSEAFARWIGERMNRGGKGIAFVLGGPDGLPADLVDDATLRLSMSPMTMPHRLARIFLAEQLYRAMTILRGEPYSR